MYTDLYDNYANLCNAIIIQATKEYRAGIEEISSLKSKLESSDNTKYKREIKERIMFLDTNQCSIEKFFHSAWFKMLTDVDGDYLLNRLKGEYV